jgi:hypothetical protein
VIFQHIFFISKFIGVDGASRIGLKRFRVIWQDTQDHVTEVYVLARIAFAGAGIVTAETIGPNILNVCLQRRVCKVDRTNGFGIEIAIAGLERVGLDPGSADETKVGEDGFDAGWSLIPAWKF